LTITVPDPAEGDPFIVTVMIDAAEITTSVKNSYNSITCGLLFVVDINV
jgi:hypothetical protein